MQSVTLCMIERIIKLMKTQEEVWLGLRQIQTRTLRQLQKLQRRQTSFQELMGDIRYDLTALLQENRDYHKTSTTLHTLKLNISRDVLKELRNNKQQQQNNESYATSNQIASCKKYQVINNLAESIIANKMMQTNHADYNRKCISNSIVIDPKEPSTPLQKRRSIQTSKSGQSTLSSGCDIEKSNCSPHILVPFDKYRIPTLYDYDKLVPQIALWTGEVFSDLSEDTFQKLRSNKLTQEHLKTEFSSNLILNSVLFMGYLTENYPYIWKPRRNDILKEYNVQSQNALKYLMTKYTVKKRETVDHSCEQLIKEFSYLHHPDNDSLASTKIRFEFSKDKQYNFKIKEVLNAYIKFTKRYYNRFQREINKVATIDLSPPQQYPGITINDMGNSKMMNNYDSSFLGPYHNHEMSVLLPEVAPTNRHMIKSAKGGERDLQAGQTGNSKVLKGLIGMKIKPETGLYTPDELREKGIKIKTAEVLRVIIKWIESLEKKITNIRELPAGREVSFPSKIVGGETVELTEDLKELLKDKIEESFLRFEARNVELGEVEAALTELYPCIQKNKGIFRFIPENEVVVGLATYILSDPVSKITTSYLESLIHCLLEAESNFNAASNCDPISLLSFGIYDLLRAKFEGTREEVAAVYNNLSESKAFKIIRIKNRLDTINRDFLLNLKLMDSPLICELQLGINLESEMEAKSQYLQKFSHFLYELDRAKYGPFIEAVIINNHESPTISYFETALKQQKVRTLDFEVALNDEGDAITVHSYVPMSSDAPFSCKNCWKFVYPCSSFLQSFEEDKVSKGKAKKICGDCIIERLSNEDKKRFLLGKMGEAFQEIKVSQIPKLRDGFKRYICVVLNGSQRNVKVLEVQGCVAGTTELVQTFVQEDIVCDIYDLQDLCINQAFKLKDDVVPACTPISNLTEYDIIANREVSLSDLNRSDYLTIPLRNCRLVLDVWCDSPSQKLCKQSRINNIRGVMEELKEESESEGNIKSRILALLESNSITISNRKLNAIDIFVSPQLQVLNVSSNLIVSLEMQKYDLPMLEELDISYNRLVSLDLRQCRYGCLKTLKAHCNQLQNFEVDQNLSALSLLDLGANRLQSLSLLESGRLPSLSIVILDHNFIRQLNFAQCELLELRALNLKHNYITTISDFSHFDKLEYLDLSVNFIQEADFCNGLKNLNKLDMSSNRLYKISGLQLQNIKEMILCFNYLQNFNLQELANTKIEKLNIAYNRISEIHYEQGMITTLRQLLLQKNKIAEFKWDKSIRATPFIRLADRRSLHEYSEEQILGIMNWQLNQLPVDQVSSIFRYMGQLQSQKEFPILNTSLCDLSPFIRYDSTDTSLIKDILGTYSMIPEENPASSLNSMRQVEYRVSSLNQSTATRLRRIIEENL